MIRTAWTRLTTVSPLALAAGLAAIHVLVALAALDPTPHSGGDNAAYLTLAASLAEGGEYLQLWDPDAPPHAQYPPGFPALLAAALSVGIASWTALKTLMVLISGVAVALSYRWARARAEPGVALGIGILLALAPGIIGNAFWVLSDVPFWAATMGALWLAAKDRPGGAAVLAFAALLLRTAGLPLVLALAGWLALRRRWGWAAGVLATLAALGLAWSLRAPDVAYASDLWLANPYVPDEGTIGLAGLLARMVSNAGTYAFGLLMDLLAGGSGPVADLVAAGIIGFALVGWARRVRSPGVPELMLPLYMGMVLAWPGPWAADRLLLPVLPVILLMAAEGTAVLPSKIGGAARVGTAVLVLAVAASFIPGQWEWGQRCRSQTEAFPGPCVHPDLAAFLALAAWTQGRLPEDAAALSRKPTFFHFYAGVPGRAYPFTAREGALFEEAERAGARYVVVDRLGAVSASYLLPVIAANADRFCVIQIMQLAGSEAALLGILPEDWTGQRAVRQPGQPGIGADFPVCPADFFR